MQTIRITSQEDDESHDQVYSVACGNLACNERREMRYPTKRENIDVYATFVDDFARTGV
jgi:transcription elongation factor Elf1